MAWDPHQGQPDNPNSGYGTPQNPYGTPPENPYTTPPYSNLNYSGAPGCSPPPSAPLPLGEAIRGLPKQYIKVITRPGAITFAEEMGKAGWNIVWVQLITLAIISSVLGYLSLLEQGGNFNSAYTNPATQQMLQTVRSVVTGFVLGSVVLVPLFFFISMGIYYGLAKAFGGQGRFLTQCYTYLLFSAPLGLVSSLFALIPIAGSLIVFAIGIYDVVLAIFSIMAVHRLGGGKASAVVLIPIGVAILLGCALAAVFIALIASAIQHP